MTRETKIGLLVGLAFIIVIGILLSDHFRPTIEPASLVNAASDVREAMNAPMASNPPITIYTPPDSTPRQAVPTQQELNPPVVPANPVAVSPVDPSREEANRPTYVTDPATPQVNPAPPQSIAGADGPGTGSDELSRVARRNGEEIVGVDQPPSDSQNSPAAPSALKTYKAQPGDSVSRMAAKLMGSSSRANVRAIIDANPSLKDDPDTVIIGKVYVIPTTAGATAQNIPSQNSTDLPTPTDAPTPSTSRQYFYTVQDGDSLWRIANDVLGDASQVDALKELNASVLKGDDHDVVISGTKLRLPSKPVASAN
jgi:nucleoid-associated protein YgaU